MKPLALAFLCCACAHIGQRSDLDAAADAARKERIAGHWDEAIRHLQPPLEEARRRGRTDAEARLLNELGQAQAERAIRRGENTGPALATFERIMGRRRPATRQLIAELGHTTPLASDSMPHNGLYHPQPART